MTIDIGPSAQLVLVGLVAVTSGSLFLRAMIFFRHERRGQRSIYPNAWTTIQCRAIEWFRQVVGLVLLAIWGAFIFVAPAIDIKWPHFGIISLLILLLLVSNAWLLLLLPRNWEKFGAMSRSFSIVITFLLLWWGMTFTATGWLLAKGSTSPRLHTVLGVYAAADSYCGSITATT
jgi:hypothetical protein